MAALAITPERDEFSHFGCIPVISAYYSYLASFPVSTAAVCEKTLGVETGNEANSYLFHKASCSCVLIYIYLAVTLFTVV